MHRLTFRKTNYLLAMTIQFITIMSRRQLFLSTFSPIFELWILESIPGDNVILRLWLLLAAELHTEQEPSSFSLTKLLSNFCHYASAWTGSLVTGIQKWNLCHIQCGTGSMKFTTFCCIVKWLCFCATVPFTTSNRNLLVSSIGELTSSPLFS